MIPTNARKKFNFNVAPSDRQLWAIGMVIVQWTSIEQMVKVPVGLVNDQERVLRSISVAVGNRLPRLFFRLQAESLENGNFHNCGWRLSAIFGLRSANADL
jgi:hypothetical protein